MDWLIGGWQTNLIGFVASGQPFDLSTSLAQPGNRPDMLGPISYPKSVSGTWFNTSVFSNTSVTVVRASASSPLVWGRLGTMGRNQLHGPGDRTVDFSAQKNVHLTE